MAYPGEGMGMMELQMLNGRVVSADEAEDKEDENGV